MPDLKMALAIEAEAKLRPLADLVTKLTKQLAHLRHRLETERGNAEKRATDLESLKAASASYLTQNDFGKFRTRLKRITEDLAAARESVALFETDLLPRTERGLQAAREKLAQTFAGTVAAAKSDCEARMTDLLSAVVAEHDAFLDAISDLGKTYNTVYQGKGPVGYSSRLGDVKHTMSGRWWLTLLRPPAPAAAAATMPAVPANAAATLAESPPMAEVEESATGDGPLPPDNALDVQDDAPAATLEAPVVSKVKTDPLDVPPAVAPAPPDLDAAAAAEADAG